MTQLDPQEQQQVVDSFDVSQATDSKPNVPTPQKWRQKHAGKIKAGAVLGVLVVLTYVFSGLLLNLRIINADSIAQGANAGDIIGTIYTNADETAPISENKTVALSINGGAKSTIETDVSGSYIFTDKALSEGDVVSIFLDDEEEKASFIFIASGVPYMESVKLFTNHVELGHFNGGPITNANLDIADNVADDDLGVSVSSGVATIADGKILRVNTDKTYSPGGAVICHDLDIKGNLEMSSDNLTVSGSFSVSNEPAGSLTMSQSATLLFNSNGAENINTANSNLGSIIFNGNGGEWTLQDNLSSSSLHIAAGKLIDNAKTVTVNGNIAIDNAPNLLLSTGDWIMAGTGQVYNLVAEPYYVSNIFNSLTIKTGASASVPSLVNTRKFIIENSSQISGSNLHIYPVDNDFFIQGSNSNITLSNLKFLKNLGDQNRAYEVGLVDAPSTTLAVEYGTGVIFKMTGAWRILNLILMGGWTDKTAETATTLDTNNFSLTINKNFTYGFTKDGGANGYHARVLFRNGVHRIGGSIDANLLPGFDTHGYFDFGSSKIYVGGNWTFRHSTLMGANTGTVILNGSGAQTFSNSSSLRLNNLTVENVSSAGITFDDGLYLDGIFTNVTPLSKMIFKSGAIYSFPAININGGSAATKISMVSSTNGSKYYFTVASATPAVEYALVRDANAIGGSRISALIGGEDLGGNINWEFGANDATPISSPSLTPQPSDSISPQASSTIIAIRSKTLTPVPSISPSNSISVSDSAAIISSPTAMSDIGNNLLADDEIKSGSAIVLVVGGKAVKVTESDEVKFNDSTPEFKGVTEPNAYVDATITGRVVITQTTKADELGAWFVGVKEKLPNGKYLLNLTFRDDGRTLGARSYRFEVGRNYWMDALYVLILLAILAALITLPSRMKKARFQAK